MKAVRLHKYGERPAVEQIAEPEITDPLDVIVRIGGAGPRPAPYLRHPDGCCGRADATLQEWLGHRDIKTTMIYADYAPSDQERELVERAFNPETAVLPEVIAETSPSPSGE